MTRSAARRIGLTSLVAVVFGGSDAAGAQDVYRCAAGVYSQQPCDGGRRVDVADPRSAAQTAQAQAAGTAQARLADRMQRERTAFEQSRRFSTAVAIGPLASRQNSTMRTGEKTSKPASRGRSASKTGTAGKLARAGKAGERESFIAFGPASGKPARPVPRSEKPQD